MRRALVVSLNFNPGHVSHLVAYYKLMEDLGYLSVYYVNESFVPFLPKDSRIEVYRKSETKFSNIKVAIFTFPSEKNIWQILSLKIKNHSKIIYIFHEPFETIGVYRKAGFKYKKLKRIILAEIISTITVWMSNVVSLPSKKAVKLFRKNWYYFSDNILKTPLLYDDEKSYSKDSFTREYFSYIGTIAPDHSFDEYLNFIEKIILEKEIPNLNFMVATRSKVTKDERIVKLLNTGRLKLVEGTPLSNKNINKYYNRSILVWNAYERTTQSGVLAKAFMFGTPVIGMHKNANEFLINKFNAILIENNNSYKEILDSTKYIISNFESFSFNCRRTFLEKFYYKNYTSTFRKII